MVYMVLYGIRISTGLAFGSSDNTIYTIQRRVDSLCQSTNENLYFYNPKADPKLQRRIVVSFDALRMLSWSQWICVTAPLCPSSVRHRSVRTSHARTVQSADALTTHSGLAHFVTYTAPRCPSSSETHFFRVQSHSRTLPSAPPEASRGPVTLLRRVLVNAA